MLKELGLKYVVSRAEDELHGKVLYRVAADKVIFPERDMAIRLAHSLTSNNVLDYLELSTEYRIVEIITPSTFIGKSLEQLQLRVKYNIIVLAIKRVDSDEVIVIPGKDCTINDGDILVVVGKDDDLLKLQK
jgi:trk system potassium uptake protein TrkA